MVTAGFHCAVTPHISVALAMGDLTKKGDIFLKPKQDLILKHDDRSGE
jgi:hypothetical protein